MRSLAVVLVAIPAFFLTSCIISIGGKSSWLGWGWSDLEHSHVEELALDPDLDRLDVVTGSGDILVRRDEGAPRLVVTVREEEPGDGMAYLDGHTLRVRSRSGDDVAIGAVEVYLAGETGELVLSTGSGDVDLEGTPVAGQLSVSTGSGDVEVAGLGNPAKVVVGTGSGEIVAASFRCRDLVMDTGSGDIEVVDVLAEGGSFDTGSGDVRVKRSSLQHVDADTGSGDIDVRGSEVKHTSFRTGSGSVRQ